ncbi:RNA recognition motif domain, partial [Dillenia turbinata]
MTYELPVSSLMDREISEDHLHEKVPVNQNAYSIGVVSEPTNASNWTINVSDIRTIKVSNISLAASERDIKEFFSFSGDIQHLEMQRESEMTQLAYVTFKNLQGADTAMLLSGAFIADLPISICPAVNYQLPTDAPLLTPDHQKIVVANSAVHKAEDAVSSMLARGYVMGKDALSKARAFDEQHNLTSNASATVASIDYKIGLSEKLSMGAAAVNEKIREMDERFQVFERTKSALAAAQQKGSNAGSAMMSNRYVSTGASWFSSAYDAVAKAAGDVGLMTREKVEKAEEERKEVIYRERTGMVRDFAQIHLDDSAAGEPPLLQEGEQIMKIPISWRRPCGRLIWHFTRDGLYSVKNGYRVSRRQEGSKGSRVQRASCGQKTDVSVDLDEAMAARLGVQPALET